MLRDYYARDSHDNDLLAIIIAAFRDGYPVPHQGRQPRKHGVR
jgi:hypothetical protein